MKVNYLIEKLVQMIKLKEREIHNKIDSLVNNQNDEIISIEHEVHQILGNLATYSLLSNNSLYLMPIALDDKICELSKQ